MRLSKLQKYILLKADEKKILEKEEILLFYKKNKDPIKQIFRLKIISKSLNNLIKKGLLIAVVIKTQKRCYIKQVSLTNNGKKVVKELKGKQLKLKLKHKLREKRILDS